MNAEMVDGPDAALSLTVIVSQGCDQVGDVVDAERKVVVDTGLLEGWGSSCVEHVRQPIASVGHLHHIPVEGVVGMASMPVGMEAEDALPERILFSLILDHEADMNDSAADGVGSGTGVGDDGI